NGRIGRLLITLFLVSKGILIKPTLYLSDFFERNKSLYYDNLTRVRTNNDLRQWLLFFFEGVRQTAENSIDTFKNIITLRSQIEQQKIVTLGKKTKTAQQLLNQLYGRPIIDSTDVANILEVNPSTALRMIDDFIKLGILDEMTGFKRNRIFIFSEYVNLFK
ncbi:MAG: Fic family protein, partial [Bacteroidales bacterium]